jgi:peptidoglycan/LPS O-acetylase OafA/YrhL
MSTAIAGKDLRAERPTLVQQPAGEPRRDPPVDSVESARVQTLRGIACLLLVAFHTIGSSAASGLHVPDPSIYRKFTNLFVHVRMPLFTFLSGVVYAYRPLRAGHALQFLAKKVRRLGVPLIVASTLLYCLHRAMHHEVPPLYQLWTIYVFPYWHLWFVQALLIVFGALFILETAGGLATFQRFMTVFALSILLYFSAPFETHNVFGVYNATYLLPFFLWGLGAHRYREQLQGAPALVATVLCFSMAQGFQTYLVLTSVLPPIDPLAHRSVLNLLIGLSASLTGLQLLPRARLLERVGRSSYPIYLYHPLFVAATLFVIGAPPQAPTSLLFVLAGAAGVLGPMMLEPLSRLVPAGELLLQGQTVRARPVAAAGEPLRLIPRLRRISGKWVTTWAGRRVSG